MRLQAEWALVPLTKHHRKHSRGTTKLTQRQIVHFRRPSIMRTKGEELGVQRQPGLANVLQRGVNTAQEDGEARVDGFMEVGQPLA